MAVGVARFWLGLAIGSVVGAGAMYLGLRAPWRDDEVAAEPLAAADRGSGTSPVAAGKKKGKKGGTARRGGGQIRDLGDGGGFGPAGEGGDDGGDVVEESEPIVLTPAQKAMIWQGDSVNLPPRTVDMADSSDARSLDDNEISATIARRGDAMIDCIVGEAAGTELVATVTLKMIVGGNGRVTKMRVQAPRYLFEKGLLGCARRAAGRFDFPATGAPSMVVAPFELGR